MSAERIDCCIEQILATKKHEPAEDADTAFLLDTDLAILGTPPEAYDRYSKLVRKEYAIYPHFRCRKGRSRVLKHFLAMPFIFQTDYFRNQREAVDRENVIGSFRQF